MSIKNIFNCISNIPFLPSCLKIVPLLEMFQNEINSYIYPKYKSGVAQFFKYLEKNWLNDIPNENYSVYLVEEMTNNCCESDNAYIKRGFNGQPTLFEFIFKLKKSFYKNELIIADLKRNINVNQQTNYNYIKKVIRYYLYIQLFNGVIDEITFLQYLVQLPKVNNLIKLENIVNKIVHYDSNVVKIRKLLLLSYNIDNEELLQMEKPNFLNYLKTHSLDECQLKEIIESDKYKSLIIKDSDKFKGIHIENNSSTNDIKLYEKTMCLEKITSKYNSLKKQNMLEFERTKTVNLQIEEKPKKRNLVENINDVNLNISNISGMNSILNLPSSIKDNSNEILTVDKFNEKFSTVENILNSVIENQKKIFEMMEDLKNSINKIFNINQNNPETQSNN